MTSMYLYKRLKVFFNVKQKKKKQPSNNCTKVIMIVHLTFSIFISFLKYPKKKKIGQKKTNFIKGIKQQSISKVVLICCSCYCCCCRVL